MTAFLLLLFTALCALVVVGGPLYAVHLAAEWWYSRPRPPEPEVRQCLGCGAEYDASWDPPDFSALKAAADPSWMSGGLCPDCSGAD